MSPGDLGGDLSSFSMLDLFRAEAESQVAVLVNGLLALEKGDNSAERLADLMRAAHSLKGAARIVGAAPCADVAHVMEDCFVAAQGGAVISRSAIDVLLKGVDLLDRLSKLSEQELISSLSKAEVEAYRGELAVARADHSSTPPKSETVQQIAAEEPTANAASGGRNERALRVQSEHVDKLLAVAAESITEARKLDPLLPKLLRGRRLLDEGLRLADELRAAALDADWERIDSLRNRLRTSLGSARSNLLETWDALDGIQRRTKVNTSRLYGETLRMRMRPFGDVLHGLPRMIRDVSRSLGKEVAIEVEGEEVEVDREALERLETMLVHLVRNAIDHGLETPDVRRAAGKPPCGTVRLSAAHEAGTLRVRIADDGHGIDPDKLRRVIVDKRFADAETAKKMTENELLEFLFLPGFSAKETVTEISGRGVGLDAVQVASRELRGSVRVQSDLGKGTIFEIRLPLALSVLRILVVRIGGDAYGFPLARVARVLTPSDAEIQTIEGKQMLILDGVSIGLISAAQLLDTENKAQTKGVTPIVCLKEQGAEFGFAVEEFKGVREVVVQPLDSRIGKVPGVSAGALLADGEPVLLLDVDDLIRGAEKLAAGASVSLVRSRASGEEAKKKRVLVVDDSLTVRELERKLLQAKGYQVETAMDGMEAWHMARTRDFELVLTDVDMPRLDGIELTKLIKADPELGRMPVMIVSYKDREEDRMRGLDAGADYYLTKGSFQDDTLLEAVEDLIGPAE